MTSKGRGRRPSPLHVSQGKLDRMKARLPEPQNQADCMWSGGKDGDTHSPLDWDDSMARLSSHPGDAARITGERFERGIYIERIYLNAKRG